MRKLGSKIMSVIMMLTTSVILVTTSIGCEDKDQTEGKGAGNPPIGQGGATEEETSSSGGSSGGMSEDAATSPGDGGPSTGDGSTSPGDGG